MALTRPYTECSDLKKSEYRIVDDQIRKIITIEVVQYEQDAYDLHLNFDLRGWLESEEATWLRTRWVETPNLVQTHSVSTYAPVYKLFVRLYEEDAVMYVLKWK